VYPAQNEQEQNSIITPIK